jgi:hypothetical protein
LSVLSLIWVCTSIFVHLVCVNKMFDDWQAIGGKFPGFLRLFFYILVAGIYVTETVKKCLQFVYIFADLLPVKFQTIFSILRVKCLTNCLLLRWRTIVWQEFKLFTCFLKHIACTIGWRYTPFLPNNRLTKVQASLLVN